MAIKDKNPGEVVSIYDPDRQAYREVSLEALERQMLSLGLTPEEAADRVEAKLREHLGRLGFTAEEAEARVKKLKKEA